MLDNWDLCFMIYMFLCNYPSSRDINSSNLSCSNYAPGAKNCPALCGHMFYTGLYEGLDGGGGGLVFTIH